MEHAELSAEELRKTVDPNSLGFDCTSDLKPTKAIVGQNRAVDAIRFGLDMHSKGFNIYVAGPPGIGKMTTVKSFLEKVASEKKTPPDWCYVNNFDDPYSPRALKLPAGRGSALKKDMKNLISYIRRELPKLFQSDRYSEEREKTLEQFRKRRQEAMEGFSKKAESEGFTLQSSPFGLAVMPAKDGQPMEESDIQSMPESERKKLEETGRRLRKEMEEVMKTVRQIDREADEKLKELDKNAGLSTLNVMFEEILERYGEIEEVKDYLEAVKNDILENISLFKQPDGEKQEAPPGMPVPGYGQEQPDLTKYDVNVIVDNSKQEGAPVILELNPAYNNLLGKVEKEARFGALQTNFMMIKPGAAHRANGGFLVISIEDLLRNIMSWEGLKRALQSEELKIEEPAEWLGFMATKSLRPEPIPADLKIVVTGDRFWYLLLQAYDKDFGELFKVKADFTMHMDRTDKNLEEFLNFVCTFCEKEKLRHLDKTGVARLVEHASRLAGDRKKISTHFGAVVDIIREADFWAGKEKSPLIGKAHIDKTVEQKIYRSNLVEEQVREMIQRGTLLVDTDGEAAAQVNGLSIVSLGDYYFGRPSRITASVGPGRGGIVDIEREVEFGGPVHSKGVLILSGYLQKKFGGDRPLAMSGRIVFEQSYEGVEGDSASSTELYCILSALAGAPLKQGIGVTGSVNQHGDIQAIGGVNQKIEGFFEVCRARGLTGGQGVIIPRSNIDNLMLKDDVTEAVRGGKFHVWPVSKIDEGIEILTGMQAGERGEDGSFPEDSFNALVDRKLEEFSRKMSALMREEAPPGGPREKMNPA